MMSDQSERVRMRDAIRELAGVLIDEPGTRTRDGAEADARRLIDLAKHAERWAVRACNGQGRMVRSQWVWDEASDQEKERADAAVLRQADAVLAPYGATAILQGDPRGIVLRIKLASGRTNTFARDGWGVA